MSDIIEEPIEEEGEPGPPPPPPPMKMVDGVEVPLSAEEIAQHEADALAWANRTPPPRMIAKTTIYRRATDEELAAFEAFLAGEATTRQRLMWQDAEGGLVLVSDVQPIAEALYGAERAAELLA